MTKTNLLKQWGFLFIVAILTNCSSSRSGINSTSKTDKVKPVVIDGKPRFVIGCYHNPNNPAGLKELADNGFNLVRASASKRSLDMIEDAGLYAWINTGQNIDFSADKEKRKEKLKEFILKFKDHPALAVWEVPDEALWSISYPRMDKIFYGKDWSKESQDSILRVLSAAIQKKATGFTEGCSYLKSIDPEHPIWMNHAPRNTHEQLRLFSKPADIIGCDIYPGYKGVHGHNELHCYRMSSVGAYTDLMQKAAPGKPVWMVLQAFSWQPLGKNANPEKLDPKRFPTYKHSRFMAWDAILHGAKGILYWGSFKVSSKSLFWHSILGVTREISALEPFLIEKDLKHKIKIDPVQFTSAVKTRFAYTLRKHNDDYLLVALQEDLGQPLDVSGLDFLEGKTLYELTTDRSYVVKDGRIRVWSGREPHVLCTSKRYDVVHESEFPVTWDKTKNSPLKKVN